MHKRIKALLITGVITVNTVSPAVEVFADELNSEITTKDIQTLKSEDINNDIEKNVLKNGKKESDSLSTNNVVEGPVLELTLNEGDFVPDDLINIQRVMKL